MNAEQLFNKIKYYKSKEDKKELIYENINKKSGWLKVVKFNKLNQKRITYAINLFTMKEKDLNIEKLLPAINKQHLEFGWSI